jgi:membrane protein implicated in regulation of membrane protease activity
MSFVVQFWYWFALTGVLLICELFAPGVIFCFLAVGSVAAGVALWIAPGMGLEFQFLIFAVVSAIAYYFGRPLTRGLVVGHRHQHLNTRGQALVGHVGTLAEPIVNGRGRLRIGDTTWAIAGPDMAAGFPVRVIGVHGAELKVEPHR